MTLNDIYNLKNTLFDGITFPDVASVAKKYDWEMENPDVDTAISTIMLLGGLRQPIFPEPGTLAQAIGVWSRTMHRPVLDYYLAVFSEYNPIENYDRKENSHDNEKINTHDKLDVSAYNESDYQPRNKTTGDRDRDYWHENRTHGNIGVTTTQKMIESSIELANHNFYRWYAEQFVKTFLINIY